MTVEQILKFVFADQDKPMRVIMLPDDKNDPQPWFVTNDVCDILQLSCSRRAFARLDDDEKGHHIFETDGGPQNTNIINEYGLYSLVLGCRKKSANAFKRWLKREVLPCLRKYGLYATDPVIARLQQNSAELKQILEEVQQLKLKVLEYEQTREKSTDDDTSGYVYIASSDEYMKRNIYKIGSTKDPESRIISLNTSRDIDDSLVVIKTYHVHDCHQSEKNVHILLDKYRNSSRREFFTIKLAELIETLDLVLKLRE